MNGWVYVLQSLKNDRYYIGCSENPERRVNEFHNLGKVKATRYMKPWKLVFMQKFLNMTEARRVEYKIKSFKSRRITEDIVGGRRILG